MYRKKIIKNRLEALKSDRLLVLGLLTYLGGEYTVESNRECGMGRPDIVLIRPCSEGGQAKEAILFRVQAGKQQKENIPAQTGEVRLW